MNYYRKILTLVQINRHYNSNKDIRAQYDTLFSDIHDKQLIFLDEKNFNLISYKKMEYSHINTKCFINVTHSKDTNVY